MQTNIHIHPDRQPYKTSTLGQIDKDRETDRLTNIITKVLDVQMVLYLVDALKGSKLGQFKLYTDHCPVFKPRFV
jgi:hypothetical protein